MLGCLHAPTRQHERARARQAGRRWQGPVRTRAGCRTRTHPTGTPAQGGARSAPASKQQQRTPCTPTFTHPHPPTRTHTHAPTPTHTHTRMQPPTRTRPTPTRNHPHTTPERHHQVHFVCHSSRGVDVVVQDLATACKAAAAAAAAAARASAAGAAAAAVAPRRRVPAAVGLPCARLHGRTRVCVAVCVSPSALS
jgi:hypothetical protein